VRRSAWCLLVGGARAGSFKTLALTERRVAYVEAFRHSIGKPIAGFVFPGVGANPINLDSFARWQIVPILNRYGACKKAKHLHGGEDHEYKRDESLPLWKGFHGFRRGSARHLAESYQSGDGMRAAQAALRHTDEGVTSRHYVQPSGQERRRLAARRDLELQNTRHRAAATLGAGIKRVQ
jgi:integrase